MPEPGAPSFFNKKLGPLPVWAWTGIGGGVAAVGYFFYKRYKTANAAASSTASTSGTGLTTGQYNQLESQIAGLYGANSNYGYGPSGGGYYSGSGSGSSVINVNVPNVVGATIANAQSTLSLSGLIPSGDTTGTDIVSAQSPSANTSVLSGSTVNLVGQAASGSSGNNNTGTGGSGTVSVPNVVGLTVGQAADAINGAGLRGFYDSATIALGANDTSTVTGQSPSAGASVAANSIVTISAGAPAGSGNSSSNSNSQQYAPLTGSNNTLQNAVNNTPPPNSQVVQQIISSNPGVAYGGYTANDNGVITQGYGYYYPGSNGGVTYTANNSNTPQSLSTGV